MNKSFFGLKKAKIICALMTIIILTGIVGMTSKAQTERRASNIKSKGIFDYSNGTVVMDASDLTYLADEIDLLEETYKKETVKALNKMSTYFMMDNSTTHDPDENNLDLDSSVILPFGSIIDGILESQSIPTEKTYTGTLPGEENETTGNISAATADSISLGSAAWVDGELIIGTGADNNSYYNQGYEDGLQYAINASSVVPIYHQHNTACCPSTCRYTITNQDNENGSWSHFLHHENCGAGTEQVNDTHDTSYWGIEGSHIFYTCGKTTETVEKYVVIVT